MGVFWQSYGGLSYRAPGARGDQSHGAGHIRASGNIHRICLCPHSKAEKMAGWDVSDPAYRSQPGDPDSADSIAGNRSETGSGSAGVAGGSAHTAQYSYRVDGSAGFYAGNGERIGNDRKAGDVPREVSDGISPHHDRCEDRHDRDRGQCRPCG